MRQTTHAFSEIEVHLFRNGREAFIEMLADRLAYELQRDDGREPYTYSCHPCKVDGFDGFFMTCRETERVLLGAA